MKLLDWVVALILIAVVFTGMAMSVVSWWHGWVISAAVFGAAAVVAFIVLASAADSSR
jgi:uncharacterized membrane protein